MAFKQGNRHQQILFPPSIEEYVASDDVVREYDAIIDGLDINSLGLVVDNNKVGAPSYDLGEHVKVISVRLFLLRLKFKKTRTRMSL